MKYLQGWFDTYTMVCSEEAFAALGMLRISY